MFQYPISKLPNDRFLFWWQQDFYVLTSHSQGSIPVKSRCWIHAIHGVHGTVSSRWHCPQRQQRERKDAKGSLALRKIIRFTQYSCSVQHWEARCYRSFCKLVCLVINFVDFLLQLWPWNCIIRDHSYILYSIIHSSFMRFHFAS